MDQLFRPHCHVQLLLYHRIEARVQEENLVEEVHHANANGNFERVQSTNLL